MAAQRYTYNFYSKKKRSVASAVKSYELHTNFTMYCKKGTIQHIRQMLETFEQAL
jgi:hypothetical protein